LRNGVALFVKNLCPNRNFGKREKSTPKSGVEVEHCAIELERNVIKVLSDKKYVLRGPREYIINCAFDKNIDETDFVFNPNNKKFSNRNVVFAREIISVKNGFIPLRVFVLVEEEIIIHKNTCLGSLEKIQELEIVNVNNVELEKTPRKFNFNLNHLTFNDKQKVEALVKEYDSIFSFHKLDVGLSNMVQHKIETGNNSPIAVPVRRVPVALEKKVDDLIQDLLKNGIITPSDSPWCAPIVAVGKKDGSIRLCIDYRQLNRITTKSVFPIPESQHIFDCLGESMYFSTLDLCSGYYQVGLDEDARRKTAFGTRTGQYEFTRMPFGLCNAPATFQKMMSTILRKENWEMCLIYLDDVLIFGKSFEEHLERLRCVFKRLKDAGLKLSPGKCRLFQKEVVYLGHKISQHGVQADSEKTKKIENWPKPDSVDKLKSFLGFCGYYRNHIKNFSYIAEPLEKLTIGSKSKSTKLNWTPEAESAFSHLKNLLTSPPILGFPNSYDKFVLDTDASNKSIGAVLSQQQNGKEIVVSYGSRSLSNSEKNYCTTRKELLAVHYFVKKYKHYLYGKDFLIRTDHKPLTWLISNSNPKTSQYCRWKTDLESFNFTITHRPGLKHGNADGLSRLPPCKQCDLNHGTIEWEEPGDVLAIAQLKDDKIKKQIELYHKELGHVGVSKLVQSLSTF